LDDVVKHLDGQHDQSDHGLWARQGVINRLARQRFGEAVARRPYATDPDFETDDGIKQPSSRSVYADQQPDGSWLYDDDRQAIHEQYYAKRLGEATPVDNPIVVFLGGGSGSGKDSLLRSGALKVPANHVESNPDISKASIPEYEKGLARGDEGIAHAVHEESSMMSREVQRRTMESGINLVVNGTGDSPKLRVDEATGERTVDISKLAGKVQAVRDRGAQVVNGEYVTISTQEAVDRANARAKNRESPSFGRVVPEKFIREIHEGISAAVPEILRTRLYDEFRLWDNEVPRGQPARLILEQKGGRIDVRNEAAYRSFLMKSPLYAEGEFRIIDGLPVPIKVSKGRILYDLTRVI
jgi:hypothetical protein